MKTYAMIDGNLALAPVAEKSLFQVVEGRRATVPSASNVRQDNAHPACVFAVVAICAFMLAFGFLQLHAQQVAFDQMCESSSRTEVVVQSGDTLWSLAQSHPLEGLSVDETVSIIRSWNDVPEGLVYPGMEIVVPA